MGFRRTATIFGLVACTSLVYASPPAPLIIWLDKNIFKHLQVTGNRQIGLHLVNVTGDKTAYDTLTNYGQGNQTLTDIGQMSVAGQQVLGLFNFNLQFADNRYQDPASSRFSLDYNKHGVRINAGDINGTLNSQNRFLGFSRQLWGLGFGINQGRLGLHMLHTTSKSTAQTISFNGNNSPGPYYLQTSKIIPDSVAVQVDGTTLKFPDDYTVDSIIGSITFTTRTIAPTSTIVVSYESVGVNTGGGSIDGISGDYDLGKFGDLGFTAIHQTDPTAGALGTVDDRFQGYGDPSIPYFLSYVPLATYPVIVRVDGIIQSLGVDYYFSTTNPVVFYFTRPIPSTSTVDVAYTPRPSSTINGNRTDYGVNYRFDFGKKGRDGNISYSQAWSHLSNPVQPMSGVAKGLSAVYNLARYKFTADFDNIPSTFVGVESTGFFRNEVASSLGAEYDHLGLQYGVTGNNAVVSILSTQGNGAAVYTQSRTTDDNAFLNFTDKSNARWSFNETRESATSVTGNSKADISSISYAKPIGKLNLRLGFDRTQGFGPISDGITSSLGSVLSNAISMRADFAAQNGLTFGARTSLSSINTGGQSGTGTDISLSSAYNNRKHTFALNSTYALSNSGTLATLGGFSNGFGYGYNGNGFSSGVIGTDPNSNSFNSSGTNMRQWSTNATWAANSRFNLGVNVGTYDQSGSVSTNSNSTTYGLTSDYDLHNQQHLGISLSKSNTSFVGSPLASEATSLDFSLQGQPKGPWSYRGAIDLLLSSGGQFSQNSMSYTGSLRHKLNRDQALLFDFHFGTVSNYQPQAERDLSFGYEYRLFKNVALVGKYQIRNIANLDPTLTSGAYGARGFDLEFNFNFGY